MLKYSVLTVAVAFLAARGASAISQGCQEDIVAVLPHLGNVGTVLDFDESSDFTLLAPSQNASVELTEVLLTEGCANFSTADYARVVSSWVISGSKVSPSDLTTAAVSFGPPATQPGLSFDLYTNSSGTPFVEIFNAAGASNDVVSIAPASTSICGGRGELIVTDELILNPALLTSVRANTDTPDSPCDEVPPEEAVPVNEAFLSNLEFELAGNKTTATIPISALVNSTAFDEDGNEVAVTTDVALALSNALDASLSADGTEFNIEVPVNVELQVVTQGCEDVVSITNPVQISIGVEVVVDGNVIGGGAALMMPRCAEVGVALFESCGGMIGGSRFVNQCAGSAICLNKNEFFAMCIPPRLLQRFLGQGFEGTQLQCRP